MLMLVVGFIPQFRTYAGNYDSTVAIVGYTTTDGIYEDTEQGLTWIYKLNMANDSFNTDKITDLTCTVNDSNLTTVSPRIKIPDNINGVEVVELGAEAFKDNSFVQEIVLPDSITRICSEAFSGCLALKKITLGSNLNVLGDKAFYNCQSLKEITIDSALTNGNIGTYTFSGCSALEKVTIEDSGSITIPEGTFENCINLTDVNALTESSVCSEVKIRANAFRNTGFKSLYFNGNTSIGDAAFSNCKNLESVFFKNNATLSAEAFLDSFQCSSHSTIIFSGNGDVMLGASALKNTKIKSVIFEKTISKVILDDSCLDNTSISLLNIEGAKALVKKNALTGIKASCVNFNSTDKTEIMGDMFSKDNTDCKIMEFNSQIVSFAETEINKNRVFNCAKELKTLKFKENTISVTGKLTGSCYIEKIYIYNPKLESQWKKEANVSNLITCYTFLDGTTKVPVFVGNHNCDYQDIVKSLAVTYIPEKVAIGTELNVSDFSVQATLQDNSIVSINPSMNSTDSTGFVLNSSFFEDVGLKEIEIQFFGKRAVATVNVIAGTPTPTPRVAKVPTSMPTPSVKVTVTPTITKLPTGTPTKKATPTPVKKVEKTITPKVEVKINNKNQKMYKEAKTIKYSTYVNKLEFKTVVRPKKTKVYYQIVKKGKSITEKGWKKVKIKNTFSKYGKYCLYIKYCDGTKNVIQKTKGFYIDTIFPTVDVNAKTHKLIVKDKGSGIAYIKVNGKKVSNGYILSSGSYDIVVSDKAGNKKKVHCELWHD